MLVAVAEVLHTVLHEELVVLAVVVWVEPQALLLLKQPMVVLILAVEAADQRKEILLVQALKPLVMVAQAAQALLFLNIQIVKQLQLVLG
jgi:hypothetical protein